jgi:hypothetical protein
MGSSTSMKGNKPGFAVVAVAVFQFLEATFSASRKIRP